ncbi:hypothetical protein GW17_00057691, partial [Ensete ventricosum]
RHNSGREREEKEVPPLKEGCFVHGCREEWRKSSPKRRQRRGAMAAGDEEAGKRGDDDNEAK